jgi:hypothetical protein
MKCSRFTENQIIGVLKKQRDVLSFADSRARLAAWHKDHNNKRAHSRMGGQTPIKFAHTFASQRGLTLRKPPKWGKLDPKVSLTLEKPC